MQPDDFFRAKQTVPAELRTAEWSAIDQWTREKSFYMAGVTNNEILQEFRNQSVKIVEGSIDENTARKNIQQYLKSIGYQAEKGQRGTIKDLASVRRIEVALRVNKELAYGSALKARGESAGARFTAPAWELTRFNNPISPRDWQQRWSFINARFIKGRMIALKGDPTWQALGDKKRFDDALGVDYPPFAWGSGMGWTRILHDEAVALGLLDKKALATQKQELITAAQLPLQSPNQALELTPKITHPHLRKRLASQLQGLAEWRGDKFVFTDPNGSRPATQQELISIWAKGMPEKFHRVIDKKIEIRGGNDRGLRQEFALIRWIENHVGFSREINSKGNTIYAPGKYDLYDELLRLFHRLPVMTESKTLFRGISFPSQSKFRKFLDLVKKESVYTPLETKPAESWSLALSGARKYTNKKPFKVLLVSEENRSAKDVSQLVRSVKNKIVNPTVTSPLETDGEVVFLQGTKFEVIKIDIKEDVVTGGQATIYVREF
jgi:hypothetical protein